jgi:hypothetical protein
MIKAQLEKRKQEK